ncbi:glycoside hydrolase family 15 protein [Salinibacterium sp. SWN167]|uniref:glycoside hydrolase family 15 protein n=1 Tax=Salinibacterium sp. SWN167 TaxID=2792054 RepID=UPI001E2C0150|nr:glycoside hydrolase family 15 protein [Salinibacterium sp. SWN167]
MTSRLDDESLASLAAHSVELISTLQHPSGAYPASPTFSAYTGYSWFRDGAFIADGMSSANAIESASRFFDWCASILIARRAQIETIERAEAAGTPLDNSQMLATRFTFDGAEGDDDWWDFQTDGYGTWMWAAVAHSRRHGLGLERWREGIELSVRYLLATWERPCFDWWEEFETERHVSTLGCVIAGLSAAVSADVLPADIATRATVATTAAREIIELDGVRDGHLVKWLGSVAVDGSLAALISPLAVVDGASALAAASTARIDHELTVDGGVHRYLGDTFYGGGQWPLLSCMLGLAYAAGGDTARARNQLEWAASTVTAEGFLPEQVDDDLLDPSRVAEWQERWGSVATPLLWSHAMYVRLAVEIGMYSPPAEWPASVATTENHFRNESETD